MTPGSLTEQIAHREHWRHCREWWFPFWNRWWKPFLLKRKCGWLDQTVSCISCIYSSTEIRCAQRDPHKWTWMITFLTQLNGQLNWKVTFQFTVSAFVEPCDWLEKNLERHLLAPSEIFSCAIHCSVGLQPKWLLSTPLNWALNRKE